MNRLLLELFTNHYYMVLPEYLQAARNIIQNNIANHIEFAPDKEKVLGDKVAMINGELTKMDNTPSIDSRKMGTNTGNEDPSFISVYNIADINLFQ